MIMLFFSPCQIVVWDHILKNGGGEGGENPHAGEQGAWYVPHVLR